MCNSKQQPSSVLAKAFARAAPIPEAAPVTRITRPLIGGASNPLVVVLRLIELRGRAPAWRVRGRRETVWSVRILVYA